MLLLVAAVALGSFLLLQRRGVSSRVRRGANLSLDVPADQSSDELRAEADALATRGEWAQAVRARLRAVVRALEERAVIDPRPGRTAAEVAAEAGAVRPDLSEPLWSAALTFGEIWYGRRTATSRDDEAMRGVDAAVRRRPGAAGTSVAAGASVAAPAPR